MHTMNDLPLTCHHSQATDTIERFTASAKRGADGWFRLRYVIRGAVERIALPAHIAVRHRDELWRHTCFEAFITTEDRPAYVECNFAPSRAWATYRFARYRTGMAALVPVAPPCITLQTQPDGLVLEAQLHLGEFAGRALRIGLTAVVEDKAGGLSYWALRHPRSKPDFHHRGGFILRLAAPSVHI
ncbi:conserved protein of unknown function [Georgfuchsia toluolica]|uniref:DOMON-like domain-containing protein n=1 Tax=Georgfuchsia toluolica TaxID=424218 RepID=A0A916J202_9PROT|nr:DOMON-like domain-containing protein [Georgfuchsia toluolica]CAG4882493.1 conserved protein of unknown function [Georgfuchsia toluolica]